VTAITSAVMSGFAILFSARSAERSAMAAWPVRPIRRTFETIRKPPETFAYAARRPGPTSAAPPVAPQPVIPNAGHRAAGNDQPPAAPVTPRPRHASISVPLASTPYSLRATTPPRASPFLTHRPRPPDLARSENHDKPPRAEDPSAWPGARGGDDSAAPPPPFQKDPA
jgi:hypothetical protein